MADARRILKETARTAGKVVFSVADPFFGRMPGPRILIYHQIDAGLGRQMEVTEEAFVRHLDWLQANGSTVGLEPALAAASAPGAERSFVLTFDDGYDDFYQHGYPHLRRRGIPFTLYLTTNPVEHREPLFPGGSAEPLTWAQIEDMASSGLMTLGAHTHRHPDMRTVSTEQIEDDLGVSDELIERRMGVTPVHFTYPYGFWSESADPVVRRRYGTATVGSGAAVTAESDRHAVNRIPVQLSDGVVFFRRKMKGGLQMEDRVRRRLTGYEGP